MLCRLHTVYKIIHCVALHTLSDITQWVSTYYIVNCQFFLFNLEIITPGRKNLHRHRLWCLWQISGMLIHLRVEAASTMWSVSTFVFIFFSAAPSFFFFSAVLPIPNVLWPSILASASLGKENYTKGMLLKFSPACQITRVIKRGESNTCHSSQDPHCTKLPWNWTC